MRIRNILTVALAGVALMGCSRRSALTVPQYDCYRTADSIVVDGRLDEKSWKEARALSPLVDIRGSEEGPAPVKNTTIKMLWDDEYLYVGAVLEEDNIVAHLTQRDTIIYKENDFEIFLDPGGKGEGYFEIETSARGTVMDLMMSRPYSEEGNFYMPWDCPGLKLATHIEGTLNDPSDKDSYWSVEAAIPRKALMWGFDKPSDHNPWRMNFSRVEYLEGKDGACNWVWAPTGVVDIHHPDLWGEVRFVNSEVNLKPSPSQSVLKP